MGRKRLLSLVGSLCLALALLLVSSSTASVTLSVNEAKTKLLFEDTQTTVYLALTNPLRPAMAHVRVELLNPDGVVRALGMFREKISTGQNTLKIPISFRLSNNEALDDKNLIWYRLRYQVEATADAEVNFPKVSGVIGLSQIETDIFSLTSTHPPSILPGQSFEVRVRALHVLTKRPTPGVELTGVMEFDETKQERKARTDLDGFAHLSFKAPQKIGEGTIEVTGVKGELRRDLDSELYINSNLHCAISTDKPLYQPGQKINIRTLFFDSRRKALANEEVSLKISDPDDETVYREDVTTSRFGVASGEWLIPTNIRLGTYQIRAELEESENCAAARTQVKISRYDLPNFTVQPKFDRPFYTPGQNADITVTAEYLFGEPVKRGRVKVVREVERHWNYREQRWDVTEEETYEGEAIDGKFVAHVDLSSAHAELATENYSRYEDLAFAAYFTDETTNRTEQRRFDLRVTKEPIHVYVVQSDARAPDFPLAFFVSTFYADGTPAESDVTLAAVRKGTSELRALGRMRTNRYGIAKFTEVMLDSHDEDLVNIVATDSKGQSGRHSEDFYMLLTPIVRIDANKTLHRRGDPIELTIRSNDPDLELNVDVTREGQVLKSHIVQLKDGRASLVVPYRPEFVNAITIAAYATAGYEQWNFPSRSRTVLYPRNRDLDLGLKLNRASYRPGEEATADFITRSAQGKGAESVLGVVIFDKAVEERARTDGDLGRGFGFWGAYASLQRSQSSWAGITRNDLDKIDLSRPVAADLELVAEVLLNEDYYLPRIDNSDGPAETAQEAFKSFNEKELLSVKIALEAIYKTQGIYPLDEPTLRRALNSYGVHLEQLRDPWGQSYAVDFLVENANDVLEIRSPGPDKLISTNDDIRALQMSWRYFRFIGEAIDRAVFNYHARTGRYIRDEATLKQELMREGVNVASLQDPWNQPYRFEFPVNRTNYSVVVFSGGPDKIYSRPDDKDAFQLWSRDIDYSSDISSQVGKALDDYFSAAGIFPQTEDELTAALRHAGLSRSDLKDPWGNYLYGQFRVDTTYSDRVSVTTKASFGQQPEQKIEITPVTRTQKIVRLRSAGPDQREGSADDFTIASFSRVTGEVDRTSRSLQVSDDVILQPGVTGAIRGTVLDMNGAVIADAKVTATNVVTSLKYEATTNEYGFYLIKNVPVGRYEVTFDGFGFTRSVVTNVLVRSANVTEVNATLEAGGITETVTVSAEHVELVTNASVSMLKSDSQRFPGTKIQSSTPRLRNYFPETLVWQPLLETNTRGQAQLKFKLADNITTWKMSVLGSTADGQIGTVEQEIRAFQPFFVELEPPRILTEGDRIALPVVVRNYLDRSQQVDLEMEPEKWFALTGSNRQRVDVPAGDAANGIFDLQAVASIEDGKQRVTALASDDNDAIEKPVTVHPDGQELSASVGELVSGRATLAVSLPAETIPGSSRATLKIYPNLMAHVAEGVEAIMSRPYGCGEQTISSTYPSLLLLRHQKRSGAVSPMRAKAERYLQQGYDRLVNYAHPTGGFSYWTKSEPDLALTAYAVRFLHDAQELIEVDDGVLERARAWLLKQQSPDGSWQLGRTQTGFDRRNALLTAYVLRALVLTEPDEKLRRGLQQRKSQDPLRRAFESLATRVKEIDEPYLLAAYTLASLDQGEIELARTTAARLRGLAKREGTGTYWALETNTPFYGWGLAGRLETTALVVQALSRVTANLTPPASNLPPGETPSASSPPADQTNEQLIRSGLLFLLKRKDRYGVWYSTQATINVFDALLSELGRNAAVASAEGPMKILVNKHPVATLQVPKDRKADEPIRIELSSLVRPGLNQIEIEGVASSSPASAQVVVSYYVPWSSAATQDVGTENSGVRLVTKFDKTESRIGETITCKVTAERVGFSGYGMLLAEIGLPPGVDVDRASLDKAVTESGWAFSQYDVLPDRLVVYLWPRAGGISFDFKFRPRFGLKAKNAQSSMYDYYNPESRVIVAPETFTVQ